MEKTIKKDNHFKSFFKLYASEFKTFFTPLQISLILIVSMLPLIGPLAQGDITDKFIPGRGQSLEEFTTERTWGLIGQVFSQATIYALSLRIISTFMSKSTYDRNRMIYVSYSKNTFHWAKLLSELTIFIINVMFVAGLGILVISTVSHGNISSSILTNSVLYFFGLMFFFTLVIQGLKLILGISVDKVKKGLLIATFFLMTVILFVVLQIVTGVVDSIRDWITHEQWISFIPVMNFVSLSLVLWDVWEWWTVFPLIVEIAIVLAVMWKTIVRKTKEYLIS